MNRNEVTIIGEIGVNHNGELEKAFSLIDVAVQAKIDIVKFQTFLPGKMITKYAEMANYQKRSLLSKQSQYDLLSSYELSHDQFLDIFSYCKSKNIQFLSSAFDMDSLEFLLSLGMNQIKIPSGEITNLPFLKIISKLNYPIYLSTGMCELPEIQTAYAILVDGGTDPNKICVMQCTSMYPTPDSDVNLNVLKTFGKYFGENLGFSDHTTGYVAAIVAVALGARVIEKHFTLDKNLEGPDHKASLEPNEIIEFTALVKNIPTIMGTENKMPSKIEIQNSKLVRKSIVANRIILEGETLTEQNLATKRPGNGMSAIHWDSIIGKNASKRYEEDEMIYE